MKRTEICKFQLSDVIDKQILRFEVTMKHSVFVTVCQATENLITKQLSNNNNIYIH